MAAPSWPRLTVSPASAVERPPVRVLRRLAVLVPTVLLPLVAAPVAEAGGYQARARAEIRAAFPGSLAPRAIRIATCESGLNPHAVGGSGRHRYYGLFQIAAPTLRSLGVSPRQAMNARTNARAAYRLYRRSGWRPWGCR